MRADVVGDAIGDVLKDLRFKQVDTGVDLIAERLFHSRLFLEGFDPAIVIGHHHAVAADLLFRHPFGDDRRQRAALAVLANGFAEVEVDQRITAEHHEGVIKELLEVLDFLESTS